MTNRLSSTLLLALGLIVAGCTGGPYHPMKADDPMPAGKWNGQRGSSDNWAGQATDPLDHGNPPGP